MPTVQDPYSQKAFINANSLLAFDGVNDVINTNKNYQCIGNSDYTVEIVFSITEFPVSGYSPVFDHLSNEGNSNTSANGITVQVDPSGRIYYVIAQSDSSTFLAIELVSSLAFQFELDRVYHLLFTQEGALVKILINGREVHSKVISQNYNNGEPGFSIGGIEKVNRTISYAGIKTAIVRIFDKSLAPQEINQLLEFPYVLTRNLQVNCVGEWLFNQTSYHKDATNQYGLGTDAIIAFDSSPQYEDSTDYIYKWLGINGDDGQFTMGANASLVENADNVEFNLDTAGGTTNIRFASTGDGTLFSFKLKVIADAGNVGDISVFESSNSILDDIAPGETYTIDIKDGARPDMRVRFTNVNSVGDKFKMFYYLMSADGESRHFPNHGELSGWSDDEVRVVSPSLGSAVKDFYSTANIIKDSGMRVGEYLKTATAFSTETPNGSSFSKLIKFIPKGDPNGSFGGGTALELNANGGNCRLRILNQTVDEISLRINGSNTVTWSTLPESLDNKLVELGLSHDSVTNDTLLVVYSGGRKIFSEVQASATAFVNWGTSGSASLFYGGTSFGSSSAEFHESLVLEASEFASNLSEAEIDSMITNGDYADNSPVGHWVFNEQGGHEVKNRLGDADYDMVRAGGSGGSFREFNGMSPITKALLLNGTSQYLTVPNFTPTGENGYTFQFLFRLDTDRKYKVSPTFDYLLSKDDGANTNGEILIYGEASNDYILASTKTTEDNNTKISRSINDIALLDGVDLSNFIMYTFYLYNDSGSAYMDTYINSAKVKEANLEYSGRTWQSFDNLTGTMQLLARTIIGAYFKGYFAMLSIRKGRMEHSLIARRWNNGSPRNIEVEGDEICVDFQNPYDDSGTLKFPDLSSNNHDVEIVGYADLTAIQTALVDINTLR